MSRSYLLLTSARYEGDFLLRVVVYGLGDGLQPLVSLGSWAVNTSSTREFTAHDGCTKSDAVLARVLTSLTGWKSVQRSRCSARSDRPPGWAYSPAKIQKQVNWSCCCTQQAVFQCRCNTSKCVVEGLKENPQQIPRLQLLGLQFFSVLLLKRHFHKLYIIIYWRFYSDFDFF